MHHPTLPVDKDSFSKYDILPEISVILPVFNGQTYLDACIRSVLDQSLSEFELLIADDGSTDRSPHIIRSYSDPRIRIHWQPENRGLFANLNQTLGAVRAPLVRLLGQDDILEKECLAREVEFFAAHPNVGMSLVKARVINAAGEELNRSALGDLPEVIKPHLSLQYFYYYGCIPSSISAVCVRKECFDELGIFDETFRVSGDYDMWVRICRQKDLGVIHQHLAKLRFHADQLSGAPTSRVACVSENRRIRAAILPRLPAEIHSWACFYVKFRQNVFDTHYALRCLSTGRFKDFSDIVRAMGGDFGLGLLGWLLTANNRLCRPRPRFVLDQA
jgi:glycosyltransferase involved in cell wall biosynthesis